MKSDSFLERLKINSCKLRREVIVLYYAYRDPRTPVYARILVGCIIAYALSPIDLIPDFIPVLGYLDDLIIVPLGVWLALKMIPSDVLNDARIEADEHIKNCKPKNYVAAAVFVLIWIFATAMGFMWVYGLACGK